MSVRSSIVSNLLAFMRSGHLQLLLGFSVAASGLIEVVNTMDEFSGLESFGGHHGVVLVGILHTLKGVSELLDGTEKAKEDVQRD